MPTITFDKPSNTMTVVFSPNEFDVLMKTDIIKASVKDLLVNFINKQGFDQVEQDRIDIKRFADRATPQQRAAILAMMPVR